MFTRFLSTPFIMTYLALVIMFTQTVNAQEEPVITIGPKVKEVVNALTERVKTIDSYGPAIEEKQQALVELDAIIDAVSGAGGVLSDYEGVTNAFKQIREEQRERIETEEAYVKEHFEKTGEILERAGKIPGLNTLEVNYLKSNLEKLNSRFSATGETLDKLADATPKRRYEDVPVRDPDKAKGLDVLTGDSYLPSGQFSQSSVTGYMVVYNDDPDPKTRHGGKLTISITSGLATIDGQSTKVIVFSNVPPYGMRFVSFTIEINEGNSTYGWKFEPGTFAP